MGAGASDRTGQTTGRAIWRIGTRGSPLALAQAEEVKARLIAAHGLPAQAVEIEVIATKGDQIQDRALSEVGGKGLFTKEIDRALLAGEVDFGVHSMKDVATTPPDGVAFPAILPREDVRDAFFARDAEALAALPEGATVGTASLRRQAQTRWRRPDLQVVLLRGNVQTRMRRLAEGEIDATFLALAGLNRLGLADRARSVTPVEEMLPAAAQGAVGVAARSNDFAAIDALAPLNCPSTTLRIAAERAFLGRLDGSCRTPIAALAVVRGDRLEFRGEILRPDGSERHADGASSALDLGEAMAMGAEVAETLRGRAGDGFWDAIQRAAL